MSDNTLINGTAYSWSSVSFRANNDIWHGIKQISYADKLDVQYGYGTGRSFAPTAMTSGQYSPDDVKVTMRQSTWRSFSRSLSVIGSGSIGRARFLSVVQWVEPDDEPIHDELRKCRVIGVSKSQDQSSEESSVELTIKCMSISYNGLVLYDVLPTI